MSKWLGTADALKQWIEEAEIEGLAVEVHRKFDLVSEVDAKFGKATNLVVLITWLGGTNPNRQQRKLRFSSGYSVSLWARPDLLPEEVDPYAVAEEIADRIHGWDPASPTKAPQFHRLEVTSAGIVPDGKYLIIEIRAEMARI